MTNLQEHTLPRVAILMINWNAYNYTKACLETLEACDRSLFDPIVIDNSSSDDSVARLKEEFPETIFLMNPVNGGFTGGNNFGIRYALEQDYEFIMLLNNDTEVAPDFLEPLLQKLDDHPEVVAVQPKIMYNHDRNQIWSAGGRFRKWLGTPVTRGAEKADHVKYDEPVKLDWATACCILTRTANVRKVGAQNECFFYGCFDDVDWSFRLAEQGKYELHYIPDSIIFHDAGVAGKSKEPGKEGFLKPFVLYLYTRNNFFFLRLHGSRIFIPTIVAFHLSKTIATLIYFFVRGRYRKLAATFSGLVDGLRQDMRSEINHLEAIKRFK